VSGNLAEAAPVTGRRRPATLRPAALWRGGTLPAPVEEPKRTHLEVVPTRSQRRARPRALYAGIAVATLLAVVLTLILILSRTRRLEWKPLIPLVVQISVRSLRA